MAGSMFCVPGTTSQDRDGALPVLVVSRVRPCSVRTVFPSATATARPAADCVYTSNAAVASSSPTPSVRATPTVGRNHGSTKSSPTGTSLSAKWSFEMAVDSRGLQPSSGCRSATRCASAGPASSATRCSAAGTPEETAAVVVTDPSSTQRLPRTQCTAGRLFSRAPIRDQWLVASRPSSIPV